MKINRLLAFLVAGCVTFSTVHAVEQNKKDVEPIICVAENSVKALKKGFSVTARSGGFEVKSIHPGKNEIYILAKDICEKRNYNRNWKCQKCGKIVFGFSGMKAHIAKEGDDHRFFTSADN